MTGGERPHFMMINGEESHFLFLTFDSPQIQSAPTGPQDCPKLGSALNATSRWVEWGSSQGCLKFTPARGKYLEDYFFTGRCSEILNYTAAGGHESDLREVLSTLRCGPQAVK